MKTIRFSDLNLNERILRAIDDMGFEEPSKIQAEVIPVLLQGYDVIGQAQTGTGKTLAFGAPILNNIESTGYINSLILTPTRELAVQVNDELVRIGKYTNAKLLPVYGGQPIERQIKAIKRGVDVIVGTPGRVLDLIKRNVISLKQIKFLILDEGDQMLDMGFINDIEAIIKVSNQDRQTMIFSATMPDAIKKLAKRYMKPNAKHISVIKNVMTVPTVEQYYYEVKNKDKFESLWRVKNALEKDDYKKFIPLVSQLDEDYSLVDISAALMNLVYNKEVAFDYSEDNIESSGDYARLFISVGKMDRLKPKVLVRFLCSNAQISRESIGDIDIMKKFSFVDVDKDAVKPILKHCSGKMLSGRRATIQISKPKK